MKFGKRDKSIVDALFLLALFGVFLISTLFIVLFGAKIYKKTVATSEENFIKRTSYTYITEKIRQHDNEYGISIDNYDDSSVIVLTRNSDNTLYYTYIYCSDSYLKEYTSRDSSFNPKMGADIISAKSLICSKISDSLYVFNITDMNDNSTEFFVSLVSDTGGDSDE